MTGYQDTRVLVVGGLGFIGAHLSRRLVAAGARVTIVSRSIEPHADVADRLTAAGAHIIQGDMRDRSAIEPAVSDRHNVQDIVFNLAGQSGAVRSMEDPLTDLDVNCRGNLILLDALRTHSPRTRVVFVSSRLAYGETGDRPVGEDRGVDPGSIHAVHKIAVEQYLRIYGRLYGLPFTIARLTNPYGPGQPSDRTAYGVVNRLIHLALAGERLTVYGDGRQRRDYIYIDDAVDALLTLGVSASASGRVYNVGTGTGTPIVEMARAITAMAGGGRVELVPWPALAAQVETGDFVADVTRMRMETGWQPRVGLSEGLERTIAFYRAHAV